MTTALFRQQAMEHQRDRLWGEVLLLQPLSQRVLTLIAMLVVASLLTYLFWGSYAPASCWMPTSPWDNAP